MPHYLLASELIGKSVATVEPPQKVGRVAELIFDYQQGNLLGMTLTQLLWRSTKFLPSDSCLSVDQHGLVIQNHQSIVPIDEVIQADRLYTQGPRLLGNRVITKSHRFLGKVVDVLIDWEGKKAAKLYVRFLLMSRVIPTDRVIEIKKNAVIVEDDLEFGKLPLTEPATG